MTKKLVPDPPFPVPVPEHLITAFETQLCELYDVLRCATATAYECGDNLQGQARDLAMSTMHLVIQARQLAHHLIDQLQPLSAGEVSQH
ncbi:DUF3077 domain-containing protein [uncultured Pseudomonas sp.]|uniref:DUF6124 family protein n=1 Tax=uncultured Pseudomonas sp. TaxID=114707 RepID=UPI0025E7D7E6|nr:DUF3077 domain-containing protein [uncultured Pseudomonas sp.]